MAAADSPAGPDTLPNSPDGATLNRSRNISGRRQGSGIVSTLSSALPSVVETVDNNITNMLQDGDFLVRTEHPKWTQRDGDVVPHSLSFRARNTLLTPWLRRLWAAACLAGMVTWLLWDILSPQGSGLVPGIRDAFVVNSIPFSEAFNNPDPGTTTICTCTYSSRVIYSYPPYSMLVAKPDAPRVTFNTFMDYCDNPNNSTMVLDRNHSGAPFLAQVLDQFIIQLTEIRLVAPESPVLLFPDGWKAARFGEAFRTSMAASAAARARIITASTTELPSDDNITAGVDAIARLQAGFSVALGQLLGMPDTALTVQSIDARTNQSTSLNCSQVPAADDLPLALQEWCSVPDAQESDNVMNCSDAYQAYVDFCAPALCQTLGPKTPYLQAMQIMSAIGGLYSLIAMFAFALLWRTIYCTFERSFDFKLWWDGMCAKLKFCGGGGSCCWRRPRTMDDQLPQYRQQQASAPGQQRRGVSLDGLSHTL